MTPLRLRMIDAMVLRGFAVRTQETYLIAVGQMARHHRCSPDLLSDEQIQAYLLYLLQERHRSRSTVNITSCAMRFLVCEVLGQTERRPQIPMGRNPQRLPEVLSRAEVAALLAVPMSPKARTFLTTAYASGLRVSELCQLRGCNIDSAPDRMCIRVVQGKGGRTATACSRQNCSTNCGCTGVPVEATPAARTGCSRHARIHHGPWTVPAASATTTLLATAPASPSRAAFIRFDIASQHTCWRPALT